MEKKCFCCGQTKPIVDFYKHSKMSDGYLNKCKECVKAYVIKQRHKNIEYYREYDRKRAMLPHRVQARAEYIRTDRGKIAHSGATTAWMRQHPNRRAASHILNNALKYKKIIRQPCFICGARAHAHHPDYDRPLDVVWLCPKHHKEAHALVTSDAQETTY